MRTVRTKIASHQPVPPRELETIAPLDERSVALSMIQALIPLGLQAVEAALQAEVTALAGVRYAHADGHAGVARWGSQPGSIYLADQKLPITVPRVRDVRAGTEIPLATYAQLQTPRAADMGLFRRVLGGLSCREYEAAAEAVPDAFGLAKSSVSRRFVGASAQALRQFHERRHDDATWLVLLLDGKSFASDQVVIALGVTTTGEKRVLGLVQTATEDKRVCAEFLRELTARLPGAAGAAGGARWSEGPLRRRPRGLWCGRAHSTLSVAQARECRELSQQTTATAVAAQTAGRLRAPEVRRCQARVAETRERTGGAQRVGRAQSRGRARGDAHAASPRRLRHTRHELQDHESD